MDKLVKTMHHLFNEAEERMWGRSEEIMLTLYWEVGFHLKGFKHKSLSEVSKKLGVELEVEPKLFELAYFFYQGNPIKAKAVRCKQ
jgi:hypothetical protein